MTIAPRVFISSTIYDFKDLRGSLKYYLEEAGFTVLSSEFNDFEKDLDANSYTACLDAIKTCNYFILLIGNRVGGYFDEANKISITQMEYRTAYDLAKAGHMRIIAFVRQDLWTIKEDRKALEHYLIQSNLLEMESNRGAAKSLSLFPSKFANDAEFIFNFISEVSRTHEMKEAVQQKASYPVANWVHSFNTFSNIIETINYTCKISTSLSRRIAAENLKRELLSNLSSITEKRTGKIYISSHWSDPFRKHHTPLPIKTELIRVKNQYIKWLLMSGISMGKALHGLRSTQIEHCVNNGYYYDYMPQTDNYVPQKTHELLETLRDRIYKLRLALESAETPKLLNKYKSAFRHDEGESDINITDFISLIAATNALEDVATISKRIIQFLSNISTAYNDIILNPITPFGDGEEKQLSKETADTDEIFLWIMQNE